MFGRFSRQYWKKHTRRNSRRHRSFFGGEIKSMAEVDALSAKIQAHEKQESQVADVMLDREWKKVEKKHKN